jgi:aspartate aminotransferase
MSGDSSPARTSQTLSRVSISPLFGMLAEATRRKAEGRPILALTAGEPDFDTPAHIVAAAKRALDEGHTRYTPVAGTPALKAAIITKLQRDNGLEYSSREVIATTGAKQALFNFCVAVLNPGDEVIVPAPYWPSYVDIVRLAGAKEVVVPTQAEDGFVLRPEALRAALTVRTRAVFVNSPGNPSGACYSQADWLALAEVLRARPDLLLVSDEIYEHIRFTDGPYVGLLNALPELRDRTVIVNGVSKSHAMTGWRIGFAAGPQDLIGAMEAVQSHSTSNPCAVAQAAAAEALAGDQSSVHEMTRVFRSRHERLHRAVNAVPGLRCRPSGGAFYLMIDASAWMAGREDKGDQRPADDVALTHWLLDRHDLALAAGSWFGAPGYLRCSFAASDTVLDQAVQRLHQAAAMLA